MPNIGKQIAHNVITNENFPHLELAWNKEILHHYCYTVATVIALLSIRC